MTTSQSRIYALPRNGVTAFYHPSDGTARVRRVNENNEYQVGFFVETLRRRWDESEHEFLVRLDHVIADAVDEWDKHPVTPFSDDN